ncbi:MAG: hypothetical protein FWE25_08255 [Lachnospiraceae bacterium]|nr:hypothetical protein [Lachnospiraceae bacterium]
MAEKKSKAQYDIEYAKTNLKRIPLNVQKDKYNDIKAHADNMDESVNGFIKRAIDETINKDVHLSFIKQHSDSMGETRLEFMKRAVMTTIERDKQAKQ